MYYMKKSFRWSQLPSYPNREDFKFLTTFCLSKIFHYYIFYFVEKKKKKFFGFIEKLYHEIYGGKITPLNLQNQNLSGFFFALYKATKITPQK